MKKLTIYLLVFMPFALHAQQKIKGRITDQSGNALDGVTLIVSKDNKNLMSGFTNMGNFTLNLIQPGTYQLSTTLVGYQPKATSITLPADSNLKIVMQTDSKALKEVAITVSKPMIERKTDRIVFNVEQSVVASGSSAWEALGKAPGVQLTSSGTVTANKKNVLLYLDGKPLHLSGDDLSAYLQSFPSSLLAKIEVFSNPPASFEAEGAAVINIITKKTKAEGFNGTANGNLIQAIYGSYNGSTTFNLRKDKLNVYGSYGFSSRKNGYKRRDDVRYQTPGNYAYWDSPGYSIYQSKAHNYRLGADYQLTDKQVLGFLISGNNRAGNSNTNTETRITNNFSTIPDSVMYTNGHTKNNGTQYTYNINYNIKLDTNKQSLNIDLDYSPYQTNRKQYVDNSSVLPDGSMTSNPYHIFTPTTQQIDIYSGELDYNYKAGKNWDLTSGIKYSSIKSRNNFEFYNNAGQQLSLVPANSNHFEYTENTAAAYTTINGSIGKWNFNAGLRGEFTRTKGYSITLDSLNKQNYFKIFPTLSAVYKPDARNEFQFTYSYRIERPEYARLNPAKHYTNPYNYLVGNPSLQPAFINNLELGYTYNNLYNITAYYSATHNMFSNISVQDDVNKIFYNTHKNLGLSLNTGIRLSAPFHVNNWWEMNTALTFYYQQEKSAYLSGSYNYHKFAYDGMTTQSFTIDKTHGIKAEIIATYNSSSIQAIYKQKQYYSIDAGIKATILKGQGTVKLSVADIFNSNIDNVRVNYLNQHNGFVRNNDMRYGTIGFSYRFGKTVAESRKRNAGIDDEKKRTQ